MAFTVKFKELGMTKPLKVEQTNKNMKLTLELQKEIIKKNEIVAADETSMLDTFIALEDLLDLKTSYLIETLHLTEKQIDLLAGLERDVTEEIVSEMVDKFFGFENKEDEAEDEKEGKE